MPAKLDLLRFGKQAQEFCFVTIQKARLLCGNFFRRIRRTHPQNRILTPQALDKLPKTSRVPENESRHFVRVPDGSTVDAFQQRRYCLSRHSGKREL
jgi:hypothetical protein